MSRKVVSIIQWVGILVTITGLSLDKLLKDYPAASTIATSGAFLSFVIFAVMQIMNRNPNMFIGKKQVDLAWNTLLTRADNSVEVFAGDASWATTNTKVLLERTQTGVRIRALCRWPTTPRLIQQARALNAAGVQLRFYQGNLVKIRGLIVDAGIGLDSGTALTVTKEPKKSIGLSAGEVGNNSLFNYEARRYLPRQDAHYPTMLKQLFDSIWENLAEGIIVGRTSLDASQLLSYLNLVPHYSRLRPADIEIQRVSIASLHSCCHTVEAAKVERIAPLLVAYQRFNLEPFEACEIWVGDKNSLLLPPILEQISDGKLVIVDGMHRLYRLSSYTDVQQAVCIVLRNVGEPLPSEPVAFSSVRVSPTKVPRTENFAHYDHKYFRDIKVIDRRLESAITKATRA